ncbi:hypothetical protein [Pelagicoccus sp. SDUM812003]|uniref:hypothetical protein n=1 Tax=Pelagicoccus sp. SDUM812003 TaxID=3041267 RepID=UPI00280F2F6A|nr:hypothetical protein [Pelagicoccus sp. SDUM812003]MDQ8204402.1 hypothetical protein [Pelagicoccus sp. SDUM812003]
MKNRTQNSSLVSVIMEAVGLSPRKKLAPSGVRYLGMGGAFGKGQVRHCSTWDFDYKLPRVAARSHYSDFNHR